MDKSKLKDKMGRFLTQSLFLEQAYDVNIAVYTLKDDDYEYKGKMFPSLKKLYLSMEDPIEYEFATTHLAGWDQWERICDNKLFTSLINGWRKELELKLMSRGFKQMVKKAEGSPMAARWLSERGWAAPKGKSKSKAQKDKDKKIQRQISDTYANDLERLRIIE